MPLALLAEQSRQGSLFRRLEKAGLLGDFFEWFFSEQPSPQECLAWFTQRKIKASLGALHNLVSRHGLTYRLGQAEEASDHLAGTLPADAEVRTKQAIKAKVFELSLSALGQKEILALEKMNRKADFDLQKLQFDREKFQENARLKREELLFNKEKFENQKFKVAEQTKKLREAGSKLSDEERKAIVAEIDRVMGI